MPAPEDPTVSPSELVMALLETYMTAGVAPGGIFTGPADDEAQQLGCVQLTAAGMTRQEMYLPLGRVRAQLRCVGPSLDITDKIAWDIYVTVGKTSRVEVDQASTGDTYLIHNVNVIAGPSQHYDTMETWESLVFLEVMFGLQPVP